MVLNDKEYILYQSHEKSVGGKRFWIVVTIVALFLAVIDWLISPPTSLMSLIIASVYVILLLCIPFSPLKTSIAQLILFDLSAVANNTNGPSQAIGVLIAMAAIGRYCALWKSALAIVLSSGVLLLIGIIKPTLEMSNFSGYISYSFTFIGATIIGRAMFWKSEVNEYRLVQYQYSILRKNVEAAIHIHDSMSSKITGLILLSQLQQSYDSENEPSEPWRMVQKSLKEIQDSMHDVIEFLEKPFSWRYGTNNISLMVAMEHQISAWETLLNKQGYNGDIRFTGVCNSRVNDIDIDVLSLIQELFIDILVHCSPFDKQYSLNITYDDKFVKIVQSNPINRMHPQRLSASNGYGLHLYGKLIRLHKGRIDYGQRGEEWHFEAVIPVTKNIAIKK